MTTRDNIGLDDIEQNASYTFKLGNKTYKVRQTTAKVSALRDRLVAERSEELKPTDNPKELLLNLSKNRSLIPKCLSLMILHSWFKVTFFHWIYWRYLYATYTINEMMAVYSQFNKVDDIKAFFLLTDYLQENNRMIKRMSETNTRIIRQELRSEAETKSSSSSTEP